MQTQGHVAEDVFGEAGLWANPKRQWVPEWRRDSDRLILFVILMVVTLLVCQKVQKTEDIVEIYFKIFIFVLFPFHFLVPRGPS